MSLRSADAVHLVKPRLQPDVELVTDDDRKAELGRTLGRSVVTPHR